MDAVDRKFNDDGATTTGRIPSSTHGKARLDSNSKERWMTNARKICSSGIRTPRRRSRIYLIPELVPAQDLHTRLSTVAVVWNRDTRDNPLDAHKGLYDSLELDLNPQLLGSNVSFGKFLAQVAAYKPIGGIVWANSLRIGIEEATASSHVPIGQEFFSGGGSTLRGFPLNGAGPQRTIPACGNPSDPSTCAFIRVPTGGRQLVILNSEFRIPVTH